MEGQTENCYDPTRGDSCCSNTWACPSGNFCLIENVCCPDGLDPATCAVDNGVSLPADFSIDNNNEDDVETLDDFEGVADNAIDVLNDDIDVDDRDEIDEDEEIQPPDFIGIIPADAEITPGSEYVLSPFPFLSFPFLSLYTLLTLYYIHSNSTNSFDFVIFSCAVSKLSSMLQVSIRLQLQAARKMLIQPSPRP